MRHSALARLAIHASLLAAATACSAAPAFSQQADDIGERLQGCWTTAHLASTHRAAGCPMKRETWWEACFSSEMSDQGGVKLALHLMDDSSLVKGKATLDQWSACTARTVTMVEYEARMALPRGSSAAMQASHVKCSIDCPPNLPQEVAGTWSVSASGLELKRRDGSVLAFQRHPPSTGASAEEIGEWLCDAVSSGHAEAMLSSFPGGEGVGAEGWTSARGRGTAHEWAAVTDASHLTFSFEVDARSGEREHFRIDYRRRGRPLFPDARAATAWLGRLGKVVEDPASGDLVARDAIEKPGFFWSVGVLEDRHALVVAWPAEHAQLLGRRFCRP